MWTADAILNGWCGRLLSEVVVVVVGRLIVMQHGLSTALHQLHTCSTHILYYTID